MNILFHTFGKLSPTKGGTERTSLTLATALTQEYDCRCFSSYEDRAAVTPKADNIVDEHCWNISRDRAATVAECRAMLERFKIDVVIVQGSFIHVPIFREAVKGLKCKVILAHHFEPGADVFFPRFSRLICKPRVGSLRAFARWGLNVALYPRMKRKHLEQMQRSYRDAYNAADTTVLLSPRLRQPFMDFAGLTDDTKFRFIPNGLSFSEFLDEKDLDRKQTVVLIVARLDEHFKRISLALEAWRQVKTDPRSLGWQLKIVGTGADEQAYRRQVEHDNISDVSFLGRQNPEEYYREASLFLMTSRSESWGLTLTESQQMGVVPVAFDTYPTLRDIITSGHDGLIIPDNDLPAYTEALLRLMDDPAERRRVAVAGLTSCRRFLPSAIASCWWKLISTVKNCQS